MPDICDDAQRVEAFVIQSALAAAQAVRGPQAVVIDGVVCCAECEEPIPLARLKALPGVGLCVACAEERDRVE